jgi:pSer/pThr/pTyr-binding forkhead associated (FHA) protein
MSLPERLPEGAGETADRRQRPMPFGAPHVFVLVVIDGNDVSAVHRIGRPEIVLGRGETADFVLEGEQVSKEHCRIRVEGSVCSIIDAGSRNGTGVNGRRLPKGVAHRLRHLDEIEIGDHRLLLLAGRFRDRPRSSPSGS